MNRMSWIWSWYAWSWQSHSSWTFRSCNGVQPCAFSCYSTGFIKFQSNWMNLPRFTPRCKVWTPEEPSVFLHWSKAWFARVAYVGACATQPFHKKLPLLLHKLHLLQLLLVRSLHLLHSHALHLHALHLGCLASTVLCVKSKPNSATDPKQQDLNAQFKVLIRQHYRKCLAAVAIDKKSCQTAFCFVHLQYIGSQNTSCSVKHVLGRLWQCQSGFDKVSWPSCLSLWMQSQQITISL